MEAFWIILTGCLVAIPTALLGSLLVLRRQAMLGDAIAHAVLPGVVLAYLVAGTRSSPVMLAGAAAVGLLVTLLIETLHKRGGVRNDAAIGLSYTWLFAVGVILLTAFAGQVDLDQDCVLFGEIAYVPLRLWLTESGASLGPEPVWMLGGAALLTLGWLAFRYRELHAATFDPEYAHCAGLRPHRVHYELMALVSLVTVASFEAVGAVLIVALLTVPAAAAALLARGLGQMMALAAVIGAAAAAGGYYLAAGLDGSIAGAMTVVAGLFFFGAVGWRELRRRNTITDLRT